MLPQPVRVSGIVHIFEDYQKSDQSSLSLSDDQDPPDPSLGVYSSSGPAKLSTRRPSAYEFIKAKFCKFIHNHLRIQEHLNSGHLAGKSPRSDRLLFSIFPWLKFSFLHQEFDVTELISVQELTAKKRHTANEYALCSDDHKHRFPILKH